MKLKNLKLDLYLSLLCIFITTCHAGSKEMIDLVKTLKVNLSMYYHNGQNITYRGSPVQGVCSAPLGDNSQVYMSIQTKDFEEIGWFTSTGKRLGVFTGEEDVIVKHTNVSWPNMPGTTVTGLVLKFCVREPIHLLCYHIQAVPGQPVKTNRVDTAIVPATRPGQPFLIVSYHMDENKVIEGETLKVACAALVGTAGKLMIILTASESHPKLNWTMPSLAGPPYFDTNGHMSTLTYRSEMTIDGPRMHALLEIPVTKVLDGRWFRCISSNYEETLQESTIKPSVEVVTLPYKLKLNVDRSDPDIYGVSGLKSTCSSTTPTTTGLSMTLRTGDQTTIFMEMEDASGIKTYTKKQFPNSHYIGRPSFYSAIFYTYFENGNLHIYMNAVLNFATETVVTCRFTNIQVCKYIRPSVRRAQKEMQIEKGYGINMSSLVTFVVLLVSGILLLLLLAIAYSKLCRQPVMSWKT